MPYVQRKFYFPEDLYAALSLQAKKERVRITDLLRTYTERGLRQDSKRQKNNAAAALLALTHRAKREGWGKKAPRDLGKNHDKYLADILGKDLKRIHDDYR